MARSKSCSILGVAQHWCRRVILVVSRCWIVAGGKGKIHGKVAIWSLGATPVGGRVCGQRHPGCVCSRLSCWGGAWCPVSGPPTPHHKQIQSQVLRRKVTVKSSLSFPTILFSLAHLDQSATCPGVALRRARVHKRSCAGSFGQIDKHRHQRQRRNSRFHCIDSQHGVAHQLCTIISYLAWVRKQRR